MKPLSTILLAMALAAGAPGAAESANELFQQALVKERTEGNLPDAIRVYQRIIEKYAGNRKIAAQALLQLADCQSKLGDAQARKSLERLVREFGDQKDTAAEAGRRLAALGEAGPRSVQTARAIWTGPDVSSGSVSADARYMYNTDWSTGDLNVHDFSTGKDRRLTAKGTWAQSQDFAEEPMISKDGKLLAYAWWLPSKNAYQLRVANVPSSGALQPRVLFEREDVTWIAPTDWSRDGEWVAVEFERKDKTYGLGLISARDGSLRVLHSGRDYFREGRLSPDGKFFSYSINSADGTGPRQRSYVSPVDGKPGIPLTVGGVTSGSPLWTPDGSRVLFTSDLGGTTGLWSVKVVNGKPQGEPELLKRDFQDSSPMGFTRSGTLVYGVRRASSDIYVAGLDPATGALTSAPKRVNQRAIGNSWGRIAWLPDGKAATFWSRRNERDSLVLHSFDTGQEQDLREHGPGAVGPGYAGWFADGKTLLTRERKGETIHFRRENPWTGEVLGSWSAPSTGQGDYHPMSFSQDLMTIFHTKKDPPDCRGNQCTFVVIGRRLDEGKDREILRMSATYVGQPWPSPDGREIAFFTRDDRDCTLKLAALDGGAVREIYRDPASLLYALHFAWTADSSHVLAFSIERGRETLWSFPAKGGAPVKSVLGMRVGTSLQYAVSPDGRQLLFVGGGREREIWTLTGAIPTAQSAMRR